GISFVYLQAAIIGAMEMPFPVLAGIAFLLAALVAAGFRPVPGLGALFGLLTIAGSFGEIVHDLQHPENTQTFVLVAIMVALALVQIVAGVAATVQNYRSADRRTPRVLPYGLTAVAALVLGAAMVAAIPREASGVSLDQATVAALPGVTMESYEGGDVRVKAGELAGLRLENPTSAGHGFDVDELNVHVTMPADETSVAVFSAAKPGTYLFYCEPHYDKATGTGMYGTLIVEP
ncbi:MAG TPA: cupredoxin domain-containing protein, partial [Herpetosiphonaceae bacterium]|nr:cupredoxin domain-containing protein [Herpetosiphonaceae bacterium]